MAYTLFRLFAARYDIRTTVQTHIDGFVGTGGDTLLMRHGQLLVNGITGATREPAWNAQVRLLLV